MHPWGLSGPEFLWLYIAGLVVGLAVAVGMRSAARRPRLAEPPGRLTPEEVGFLTGGPRHAVEVAIAGLVRSGLVRVDRSGTLTATSDGSPTGRPLDAAVLGELTAPRKAVTLTEKLAGTPTVAEIGESLIRRRLLIRPSRAMRAQWLGPIVLYVLTAIGLARWINGMINDLPVGYLTYLVVAAAFASVILSSREFFGLKARTVHGDRMVAELRASDQVADPLERAAVWGLGTYPDKDLAAALSIGAVSVGGITWSYASGSSFDLRVDTGRSGGGSTYDNITSSSGPSSGGDSGCGGGTS